MGDYTKTRKNQNVYFWVPKKPEEMLIENRISSSCRVEERGVKISVGKKHRDCSG
jgi:hypothetical protein